MDKQNIFQGIIKYLPLITVVVLMIMAWGSLRETSISSEKRITALEVSDRVSRDVQSQMLVQLSQIQTDIQWIKLNIK